MGFESYASCEFVVHWKVWGHVPISKSKQWKSIIQPFPGALGNAQSVMSPMTTDQALNFGQYHLARKSSKAKLSYCVKLRDTSLRSRSSAATFSAMWWKFRCAGESPAYVPSCIMTAPAQRICQSHLALRHSRRYWVLQLESQTRLAYSWQSRSFWWHLIEVLVYQWILSICLQSRSDSSSTAHLPIPFATETL